MERTRKTKNVLLLRIGLNKPNIDPTMLMIKVKFSAFKLVFSFFFLTTAKCLVPGGGATNHVVPFQIRLLAAHRGVHKGTLIDDSVWPEENDLRRRFLSDEGAAFTLLFRFENGRARERSERAREIPLR